VGPEDHPTSISKRVKSRDERCRGSSIAGDTVDESHLRCQREDVLRGLSSAMVGFTSEDSSRESLSRARRAASANHGGSHPLARRKGL